jgi:hypothetical protein
MSVSCRLLNILYTNQMEASVAFYVRLGLFRKEDGEINKWWNEFAIGDASIALHWNSDQPLPTASNPEIHLQVSRAEFEAIYADINAYSPSEIQTLERMGRFFTVVDPNGVELRVNEVR